MKGRIITTAEVLPKEEGVQALHQAPHPGGSVPGRQTSRTYPLKSVRKSIIKRQVVTNAGKDVDKRESLYTADGNVN